MVQIYVEEKRRWILANLSAGKPTKGWKRFVAQFNEAFEGKTLVGTAGIRPYRSHSSLTKEVERLGGEVWRWLLCKGLGSGAGKAEREEGVMRGGAGLVRALGGVGDGRLSVQLASC